ncbi:hypothetical protein GQ457_18G010710 [Hibiscus cannabinus]
MESEKAKVKQTVEQYHQALKVEKDNTVAWKRKAHDSKIRLTESQSAYDALEIQLNQSCAQYSQLEARVGEQEEMIREYQARDEYAELQASQNKIEELEKEVKDLWALVQTCQISIQVLEDIKHEAQVQPPMLENEITLLFVNTLKDDFYDQMLDHTTKPFADMVMTGELIQAAIKSGIIREGNDSESILESEFNLVEQLNKLPAKISMFSLLRSSEPHCNTLLKLLNQTFVPKEISINMVDRLVGNISMDNFISFSDVEIPKGARGSYKALHITTRCKGYTLRGVLIDNGSALNVLPAATLKNSPIDSTHMKAYQNVVRAFDVDFVVMDIKPTYSCLLGRPWIHAAGAVPSTLHQKLKFVIDGKLVTVQGEEDIIASIATNTPYIEMGEDAMECSFRSLELVSATFVEENKVIRRPRLFGCAKMQVMLTLGRRAHVGRGFGKELQGRLYPIYVKGNMDKFGLGYQSDRRERKAAMVKKQEK